MNRLLSLLRPIYRISSPERHPGFSLASVLLAASPFFLAIPSSAQTAATPGLTLAVSSASGAVTAVW